MKRGWITHGVNPGAFLRNALLAAAIVAMSANQVAAAPSDGTVTGSVLNKTNGGGSTAGTTVILVAFGRKEQAPLGQQTVQADGSGHYSFTNVDRDPNIVYLTVAKYQNVNYPSDQPFQLQDQPAAQADITVYDATTTDDSIQLESLNLLVMGADQGLVQCMEMGALLNNGDHTFVTANPQDQQLANAIKFALPKGALSVQMQTGFSDQDVIPSLSGIQVTSPIPPGRHQFAMSFQLPYSGSDVDVSLQIPYPTSSYSVYVPETGLKLQSTPLQSGGPTQLGGQTYSLYTAANVAKSTMIGGQLSGLGSTSGLAPNQLALISLGLVLFVIGGGVLLFGGRLRESHSTEGLNDDRADSERERLELVVRMAALDERFAAGEVDQAQYNAERERGKQRLRELMLAQQRIVARIEV
ncbi:MAG: hypothetical protein JO020_20080 [Chloroflexi bacterium]|nr:hypothetical protein [Chloroflexota bacterium]